MSDPMNPPDPPRLKIVQTLEARMEQMEQRRRAPIATGAAALVSRAAIRGDRFWNDHCRKCGDHGAAFVFERKIISLCARCTAERIERLAGAGRVLPPSVHLLYLETTKWVKWLEREEKEKLGIKFDDFWRCGGCTRLVLKTDARYWGKGNPPYCPTCYTILASGEELPPKPEQTEFDFDV